MPLKTLKRRPKKKKDLAKGKKRKKDLSTANVTLPFLSAIS